MINLTLRTAPAAGPRGVRYFMSTRYRAAQRFFVSPCMVAHTLNIMARDTENISFREKLSGAHKFCLEIRPDMNISLMNSVRTLHLFTTICFCFFFIQATAGIFIHLDVNPCMQTLLGNRYTRRTCYTDVSVENRIISNLYGLANLNAILSNLSDGKITLISDLPKWFMVFYLPHKVIIVII